MTVSARRRGLPALLALMGVLLSLACAELLLRVLRPARLSMVRYPCIYRPDETTGFRYVPHSRGVVAAHFEIENEVEINSLGFYDDEPLPRHLARPLILAVGDSFTAAMNVAKEETWTSVLETELRSRGLPRADVVNLGLDGTGTDVHVALLEEFVPRLAPDVVLLAFYANDPGDVSNGLFQRECYRGYVLSYPTASHREALRTRVDAYHAAPVRSWLYRHSFVTRLAAAPLLPPLNPYRIQFLQPRRADLPRPAPGEAQARWRASLAALEELAALCACRALVVPVPARSDPGASLRVWLERAAGSSLEVLDVLPALERMRRADRLAHADLYFRHDLHLNAAGNAHYARAIAEILAPGAPSP